MRKLFMGLAALLGVLVLIQLVPVTRGNPPVRRVVDAPPQVRAVLERSCYDCHSNETVWPWYAYVAPVSWLVARDVRLGRKHLNFSEWDRRDDEREEIGEEVSEGAMPLWFYTMIQTEARLSDADRALLRSWAAGAAGEREGEDEDDDERWDEH